MWRSFRAATAAGTKGYLEVRADAHYRDVGDEPLQIKLKFPEVVVAVCEKRAEGIRRLLAEHPEIDLVVMDDGFQHRYVEPKINIVMIDATRPVQHDRMLPAGSLLRPARAVAPGPLLHCHEVPRADGADRPADPAQGAHDGGRAPIRNAPKWSLNMHLLTKSRAITPTRSPRTAMPASLLDDGSEADVVVPATLGGRDVTEIGNSARPVFDANAAIRSVTFPDTLKEMSGLPLFHECENLETITIPASVTGMNFHSVADCFIFNCPNLKTIIFKGTRAQWEAIEKEYVNLDGITVRCSDDNVDPVQPDPDQPEQPDPGDPDDKDVFLQFEDCSVDVEKPDGTTLHFDALTGVIQSQRLPKGAKVTITLDEKAIPEG